MANNPRIDDLRKRLEKEPGSRLFAQLAEELRKDGEFEEAIRIARAGLARHPSYPSARMTLGRALFDTGDMAAARHELQSVLEGAPDNILASRLLAECLESLGDLEGALQRFRATLALSPGDKQITARVQDLEGRLHAAPSPPATAVQAAPPASAPAGASVAPIPLATVDEPMELEVSHEREPVAATEQVAESSAADFELERAYEAPGTGWRTEAAVSVEAPGERTLIDEPVPVIEPEATHEPTGGEETAHAADASPLVAPTPAAADAPATAAEARAPAETSFDYTFEPPRTAVPPPLPPVEEAPAVSSSAPPSAPEEADLVSPTLAELYLNQGFHDKALEVYRRLREREPANERVRARLAEIERLSPPAPAEAAPGSADATADGEAARAARREALARTIDRLESLRAALQRGAR